MLSDELQKKILRELKFRDEMTQGTIHNDEVERDVQNLYKKGLIDIETYRKFYNR